jgi:diguanylate cyclase (GGDEF)-like protein
MAVAPGGEVYIGTRSGLYRADPQGRHVVRVAIPQRAADAATWSLAFDGDVLWIGGTDGLWAATAGLSGAMGVLHHETAERLGNQRVTAILRGIGKTLWVGTATGLVSIDIASYHLERMPTDDADPTAFLEGYVAALLMDRQQRLWVATSDAGIQILEGLHPDKRARFRRLRMRDGLPHDDVDQLLEDARGKIWASTDNGLVMIDPVTYSIRTLGVPQGVTILQYWTNSGARTAAGELLFGGQGGLTVVRPALVTASHYRPPIVVTEAHFGGSALVASSLNGLNSPKRVDIPSDDRSLMVEFSALDYTAPEDNRYDYRLRGFDKDWLTTQPTRRLAAYTNLPPGDYMLQLRGSGPEAPWTPETLNLPIRVLPAWYETAVFKLLAGMLALLSVAALMQLRTALLRRRQTELVKLVADRTAELLQRSVELRESQRRLEQIAYFDPLTGIANRRLFDSELAHLTAHALRGSVRFALLLIDLDHFKRINDTLGHDAGDALLIEVGRRLGATFRQSDRTFRIGGDEFAVLLPETKEPAEIEAACRRIVENLRKPFVYLDQILEPSTTVGAACWSATMAGSDALYKSADLALYEAKAAGRGTWHIAHPAHISECAPEMSR